MKRNWMPLYIPDFLADTMQLSAAETGAYLCLIMDYWLHDGLPDDDAKLAQIARLPIAAWRKMRPTIAAFFYDGWRHKRIDAELAKMITTSIRRTDAARTAGNQSAINAAIARERARTSGNGTSTSRQRRVDAASTSRQRGVDHSTQDITSTSSSTARARPEPPDNSPTNSTEPPAEPPTGSGSEPPEKPVIAAAKGLGEQARRAVAASASSIGSGELVTSMQAKGWVR
jgi:uncharacterized protein YdaU (DUF1376 family)